MTQSSRTTLIVLCIGIAVGGGGMYLLYGTVASNESIEIAHTTVGSETSGLTPRIDDPSTQESYLPTSSDYQSAKSLKDPTLHQNSFERSLAIYSYVKSLSVDQITNALYTTTSEGQELSHRVKYELQTALVEKLAIVDPTTAVEFLIERQVTRNDPALMSMIRSLFTDLASSDLKKAIILANTLDAHVKSNAISSIYATQIGETLATYRQIAKELGDATIAVEFYLNSLEEQQFDDPQSTWDEVQTLLKSIDFIPSQALFNIAQQWYEKDGLSVIDEISTSSMNKNFTRGIMHHIFEQEADENPEYALQSAMKLPVDDRYSGIREIVARSWARSEPQAAYQAVSNIKHSGLRENLQLHVVNRWVQTEPRYVLNNLEIFPPNISEYATDEAIQAIARTSPKEAAELTLEHVHSPWNSSAVSYVMEEWVEQDEEGAINWVYNGTLNERTAYEWVDALTSNLVYSDPRRAFNLAVRQEIPAGGGFGGMYEIGLEVEVINQIARQNIDLAVELLPNVRKGKTRLRAYKSLGDRHIDQGDSKKAFDIGLQLPLSDQEEYFRSISTTWARVDPAGLLIGLKDFPTGKVRSSVALRMSSRRYRDNFTDDQLEVLQQYVD